MLPRAFRATRAWQSQSKVGCKVDRDGIPLEAVWSVKRQLSQHPQPGLTRSQILHLHKLSALEPPATPQDEAKLTDELQELVQLVEGVRQFPAKVDLAKEFPDGRIWPQGLGMPLDETPVEQQSDSLVALSKGSLGRYYVVEAPRTKP